MNREQRRQQERLSQHAVKQAKQLAARASHEDNIQTLAHAGELLSKNRIWDSAFFCFKRLEELSPEDTNILQKQAYVLANGGKIQKAFNCYKKGLALEPDNQHCRKNICVLLFTTGHLNDALALAEKIRTASPDDPESYYLLGEIHTEMGEKDTGAKYYQQALTGFREYSRHHEPDVSTLIKITRCLIATKEYQKAHIFLIEVLKMSPSMPAAHYQLGQLFERIRQPIKALTAYRQCLKIKPDHVESLLAYSALMAEKGQLEKCAWAYRRLLLQTPNDASLKHLLNASSSAGVQGGADESYVKDVFDDYADHFDEHLVKTLAYHVPEKLAQLYQANTVAMSTASDLNIIDLGCGTGLCGPLFKPYSHQLLGVDLSAGMLKQAAHKGCYDELSHCDLVAGLRKHHNTLDLAIAADVFIYVGELDDVFDACYRGLKDNGYLLFSVESTTSKKGVILHPSGRYQHSAKHINALTKKHHFSVVQQQASDIRNENEEPVMGVLYLLRKTPFSPLS